MPLEAAAEANVAGVGPGIVCAVNGSSGAADGDEIEVRSYGKMIRWMGEQKMWSESDRDARLRTRW